MLQRVRIHEIVRVAGRDVRQLVPEQTGDAVVFPVIIEDIGLETALLQQIGAAGQVIHPGAGLLRPGIVAVEPLAVSDEVQARLVPVVRLVGGLVDDEAVQAAGKGDIGRILHVLRAVGVVLAADAAGGEGFRRDDVLPEDMGHGGRFADVGHRHRDRGAGAGIVHPDGGHRNVGRPLEVHAVPHEHMPVLVRFGIAALQAGCAGDAAQAVVVLRHQLAERTAPVEEELLRLRRAAENLPGQRRKPREQRIAPPLLEFLEHVPRPGHLSGFVAVRKHILDRSALIDAEELLEIGLPGLRVQLVHLQARRLRRGRVVLLPGQGNAEPVDAPASRRNIPDQSSALVDQGEVLDLRCTASAVSGVR